jgi:hypothetical protein
MTRIVKKIKRPLVTSADALLPQAWRNTGNRLLKGARHLWPILLRRIQDGSVQPDDDADYFAPFFLLAGLAVENYIKAQLLEEAIAAGRTPTNVAELFKNNGLFRVKPQHNLLALAKGTTLVLSSGDERLLERLSQFVLWGARYPIPKGGSDPTFRRDTRDCDLPEIEALLKKLGS